MTSSGWVLGLCLNVIGSTLFNLSLNLIRTSGASSNKRRAVVLKRFGWAALVLGSLLAYSSFAFASSTLLSSLGGVQLLTNLVFSRIGASESTSKITRAHLIATLVLVAGTSISAAFASHQTKLYSTSDLIHLYQRVPFLALESLLISLALYIIFWVERQGRRIAFLYSLSSAIIGTQSVLHSKVLAEILKACVETHSPAALGGGLFLTTLVLCLVSLAFWLHRLNTALQLFDGTIVIPLLQVFWMICATLQGAIFFDDFGGDTPNVSIFCFSLGVAITLSGIWLLCKLEQRGLKPQWDPVDTTDPTWALTVDDIGDGGGGNGMVATPVHQHAHAHAHAHVHTPQNAATSPLAALVGVWSKSAQGVEEEEQDVSPGSSEAVLVASEAEV